MVVKIVSDLGARTLLSGPDRVDQQGVVTMSELPQPDRSGLPSRIDPPPEILEAARQYADTGTVSAELAEKILGPTHKGVAILPKEG